MSLVGTRGCSLALSEHAAAVFLWRWLPPPPPSVTDSSSFARPQPSVNGTSSWLSLGAIDDACRGMRSRARMRTLVAGWIAQMCQDVWQTTTHDSYVMSTEVAVPSRREGRCRSGIGPAHSRSYTRTRKYKLCAGGVDVCYARVRVREERLHSAPPPSLLRPSSIENRCRAPAQNALVCHPLRGLRPRVRSARCQQKVVRRDADIRSSDHLVNEPSSPNFPAPPSQTTCWFELCRGGGWVDRELELRFSQRMVSNGYVWI